MYNQESDISDINEKFLEYYQDIFKIFGEWKIKLSQKVIELQNISSEMEADKQIFLMNEEMIKINKDCLAKLKENFLDSSKSMKIYFECLALQVELDKKNLEIKELTAKMEISNNKMNSSFDSLKSSGFQNKKKEFLNETQMETFEMKKMQNENNSLKVEIEESNIEKSNLKIKAVELSLKNDSLSEKLEIKQRELNTQQNLVIELQDKIKLLLNENEKLTILFKKNTSIIEKSISEIDMKNKEVENLKNKLELINIMNLDESNHNDLKRIEDKSRELIQNNAKLTENIVYLSQELEKKHQSLIKLSQISDFLQKKNENLIDKIRVIVNLNERLNEILTLNFEEIKNLKNEREKLKKRDITIHSLLKENNELRAYLIQIKIDLEEKKMLKEIIQQNEIQLSSLKAENLYEFK